MPLHIIATVQLANTLEIHITPGKSKLYPYREEIIALFASGTTHNSVSELLGNSAFISLFMTIL